MARLKIVFACQACGFESSKWLGRCPDCGEWNSFMEERPAPEPAAGRGRQAAPRHRRRPAPQPTTRSTARTSRARPPGIGEFDRVLGGGHRARLAGPHRRRAGDRQEHAAPAGRAPARPHPRHRPLRLRRGVGAPDQAAGGAARDHGRRALPDGGDLARAHPRRGRGAEARGPSSWTRCRPCTRPSSLPRPAASARCARWRRSSSSWPRDAASPRSSSGTSRRTATSRGPSRSSTSWTPSSTSRARRGSTTASCARSRTASAPSPRWASSR